ncbi:hypothetical protein JOE58_001541 [Curtobacterium luteum]|uniref:Uncharacterized protein n=1 Tax=Curtobacterium luteum TaxID=33881 RepID=A0A8H9G6G4_9MICO|nr:MULTISPECIES: hypothetical protein [Curtobacterium]MBM7802290.1 hypothetical protein [Curtobacterium luteum]NUU52394.1 hypothetical protein [Curtobacterium luteum]GGK91699.1 hypothetical protein GCM10009769_07270 [Curtobacterium luteum]
MANAITTRVRREDRFRAVQLLPAPATVLALVVAAQHDLGAGPLGVIAVVGALATVGSALLPMIRPACDRAAAHGSERRSMPTPTESDRYRGDTEHPH